MQVRRREVKIEHSYLRDTENFRSSYLDSGIRNCSRLSHKVFLFQHSSHLLVVQGKHFKKLISLV